MSITIFKHELKASLRSVIVWSVSLAVLMLVFTALFPSFSAQAEEIKKLWPTTRPSY